MATEYSSEAYESWLRSVLQEAWEPDQESEAAARASRISDQLHAARPSLPRLHVEVVMMPEVNAFTAPGQHIYISRTLQDRCGPDDALAFVIAHEMAHQDLGHCSLFDGVAANLPRSTAGTALAVATALVKRRMFSPEQEEAADLYALELCLRAGFDGGKCLQLFDVLERYSLDHGDVVGVFGLEQTLDPPTNDVEKWAQQARVWTNTRMRGYPSIRDRKDTLQRRLDAEFRTESRSSDVSRRSTSADRREVWQRGPIEGVHPLLQPAAHALLQTSEDVQSIMRIFPERFLWERPSGMASVGFHLQHIAGVIDRLFTYARAEPLDDAQLRALAKERDPGSDPPSLSFLTQTVQVTVDLAIAQLGFTDVSTLGDHRALGRAQLPTTVQGLLFHAAEHSQRHVGQLLVTAAVVRGAGSRQA